MDAYAVFEENIADARRLVDLYDALLTASKKDSKSSYLKRLNSTMKAASGGKTLVGRSSNDTTYILFKEGAELSWKDLRHTKLRPLLRMAHVQAVSAMDCYFHDQVEWRFGRIISTCPHLAERSLLEFGIPVGRVLEAMHGYERSNVGIRIALQNELRLRSIQGCRAIESNMKLIGVKKIWKSTALDMGVDAETLQGWINEIAHRRNQIVHEGDRKVQQNGRLSTERDISRDDVVDDIHVIDCFVHSMDSYIAQHATA